MTGDMPAINYKHKIVVENVRGLAQNNEKLASTEDSTGDPYWSPVLHGSLSPDVSTSSQAAAAAAAAAEQ